MKEYLLLFFGTYASEDLSFVYLIKQYIAQNTAVAFSLFYIFGVLTGDLGLYFLGRCISQIPIVSLKKFIQKAQQKQAVKSSSQFDYFLLFTRFIPGSRIPAYSYAGAIKYSVSKFTAILLLATTLQCLIAYIFTQVFAQFFNEESLLKEIIFIATVAVSSFFIFFLLKKLWVFRKNLKAGAKILYYQFTKNFQSEFFHPIILYPLVVLYVLTRMIKYKSIKAPLYANPKLPWGGLFGEEKKLIEKLLEKKKNTLKSFFYSKKEVSEEKLLLKIIHEFPKFPLVLKPNIGLKGKGVRIVQTKAELKDALTHSETEFIIQEYTSLPEEIGFFYVRSFQAKKGEIFSITKKKLPKVLGDGKQSLVELILEDSELRYRTALFHKKHQEDLFSTPEKNKEVILSHCGNHTQGALFYSGDPQHYQWLLEDIDELSQALSLYFVRIDIKLSSITQDYKIIEINGSGAESTDIYDPKKSFFQMQKKLFQQWDTLYRIAAPIEKAEKTNTPYSLWTLTKNLCSFLWMSRSYHESS